MAFDAKTGMPWSVTKDYRPEGLISNINLGGKTERYKPYVYNRKESGEIDPRLKQAVDHFEGKEPEEIVRLLIRKFGDR